MLCAAALAALEAASPPTAPARDGDASSSYRSSVSEDANDTATSADVPRSSSSSSSSALGRVRSSLAPGTEGAIDSVDKWVRAALRHLNAGVADLVDATTHEPNDALCSRVHNLLAEWRHAKITARDAGVVDPRPHIMKSFPPQCILAKARAWLIRRVNDTRAAHHVSVVGDKWARNLAGVRADAREVNTETRTDKAKQGTLYHHKHDLAPTYEQLTAMTVAAFTGDARVDADLLKACEAGMAVAIYLPTGARGSELKNMYLQSVGYEDIPCERAGHEFACLKLTAFETKTKDHHLNQFLPASNPWRCGVGALGISLLVRVRYRGPPPFTMQRDDASWKVIGADAGKSFDRRLNDLFAVAGVRRQTGDPITYLGRHFGTRVLQHQGGSAEGGAARRGHTSGATFAYSETPLPDLLRLQGNDPDAPFVAAHHQRHLVPYADAVLAVLFPQLVEREAALDARQCEVDALRGNSVRVRTDEQLNDQKRMLNGITLACRLALLCLVARPRTWRKWELVENEVTMWQRAATNRLVQFLFAGNASAIEAMNALAMQVRRCEEHELAARKADPTRAMQDAFVGAMQRMSDAQARREEELLAHQRDMFALLMRTAGEVAPPPPPPPRTEAAATVAAPPPAVSAATAPPLARARVKRKAEAQHDVAYFASHPTLRAALEYARTDLAPREKAEGAAWRTLVKEDGREDKSRTRQWGFYRQLAVAVARHGDDEEAALAALEARRTALGSLTALNKELHKEQATLHGTEVCAKKVLGY